MEIIRAMPAHAPALSAIALAAKAHWGYPAHWLERWRDELTITREFVAANDTFAACVEEEIVAFYALLQAPDALRLEHLWVLPKWMGQGIGRRLFNHAAEQAARRVATSLTIEADPNAEPFYLHLGAVRIGASISEIDGARRELPILGVALPLSCSRGR